MLNMLVRALIITTVQIQLHLHVRSAETNQAMQLVEDVPRHGLQALGLQEVLVEVVRQAVLSRFLNGDEWLADF